MAGNGWDQPQELLVAACQTIITCSVAVVIDPANVGHFVRTGCAAAPKRGYPCALFYVTSGVYIFREVPYFKALGRPPLLQQSWSLAVEEQFYLLWPLALLFLLRTLKTDRSRLLGAIFSKIAISSGCMAVLYSNSVESLECLTALTLARLDFSSLQCWRYHGLPGKHLMRQAGGNSKYWVGADWLLG